MTCPIDHAQLVRLQVDQRVAHGPTHEVQVEPGAAEGVGEASDGGRVEHDALQRLTLPRAQR